MKTRVRINGDPSVVSHAYHMKLPIKSGQKELQFSLDEFRRRGKSEFIFDTDAFEVKNKDGHESCMTWRIIKHFVDKKCLVPVSQAKRDVDEFNALIDFIIKKHEMLENQSHSLVVNKPAITPSIAELPVEEFEKLFSDDGQSSSDKKNTNKEKVKVTKEKKETTKIIDETPSKINNDETQEII